MRPWRTLPAPRPRWRFIWRFIVWRRWWSAWNRFMGRIVRQRWWRAPPGRTRWWCVAPWGIWWR
ncbi:hypothetical protein M911_00265 [Ectothiorhodospira haloalkaliphila]|uniref:Uncharacterized protein n=1 Tax=Ectothiorhodospira haloalkaliphila TaxID=421628 RepID=W8L1Q0_9GAMM|nr:hypothetical protein M911_00265 [Ectothiorhodospira haloalkaliphila]